MIHISGLNDVHINSWVDASTVLVTLQSLSFTKNFFWGDIYINTLDAYFFSCIKYGEKEFLVCMLPEMICS